MRKMPDDLARQLAWVLPLRGLLPKGFFFSRCKAKIAVRLSSVKDNFQEVRTPNDDIFGSACSCHAFGKLLSSSLISILPSSLHH
jgi:hypothetical protein